MVIDVDGARVLFGDGWGLIRASNTQPVLVTRYEARSEQRLAVIYPAEGPVAAHTGRSRAVSIPLRWRRWPVIALAVVAALLVLGRVGAGIVADYLCGTPRWAPRRSGASGRCS